jgi:hypothetical protein
MRTNDAMTRLLEQVDISELTLEDIPQAFREILEQGWQEVNGLWLLKALHEGYVGDADGFTGSVEAEATLNGRGMIDYDLPDETPQRLTTLVRRSFAYAGAGTLSAERVAGNPGVVAYVSVSEGDDGSGLHSANVTFCVPRENEPGYVSDFDSYEREALAELRGDDDVIAEITARTRRG